MVKRERTRESERERVMVASEKALERVSMVFR